MANDLFMSGPSSSSLPVNRRDMLQRCGMGMAWLGLSGLLGNDRPVQADSYTNPLQSKSAPLAAKAKRVIH